MVPKVEKLHLLFYFILHTSALRALISGDITSSIPHWLMLTHRADQSHPLVTAGCPTSLHFMNEDFSDGGGGAGRMNGEGGREERSEGMEEG